MAPEEQTNIQTVVRYTDIYDVEMYNEQTKTTINKLQSGIFSREPRFENTVNTDT